MNDNARHVLDPAEQSVLLAQAAETLAGRNPTASVVVELPSGVKARMYCRPVRGEGRLAGGVVHVKLSERRRAAARRDGRRRRGCSCPAWSARARCGCAAATRCSRCYDAGEWLALEGEPGRRASWRWSAPCTSTDNPGGHFAVLDAAAAGGRGWLADVRRELLDGEGALVIRHVDKLSGGRLRAAVPAAGGGPGGARRSRGSR